jgi:protein-S-isoprenylcysteine O-methyltransferase Ste14
MAAPSPPVPGAPVGTPVLLGLSLAAYAALGALFFGVAGRADLPWVWSALGVFAAGHAGLVLAVFRRDPELVRERLSRRPGVPRWDRVYAAASGALFLANVVAAALDVGRLEAGGGVPAPLRALGLAGIAAGLALMGWAMRVNTFFSRAVRIQRERGHRVVSAGPYRFVRHPGYLAAFLWWTGFNLAVGSWLGAALSLAVDALVVVRTALEDRFLQRELEGYADYARRVRYRLVPGVW